MSRFVVSKNEQLQIPRRFFRNFTTGYQNNRGQIPIPFPIGEMSCPATLLIAFRSAMGSGDARPRMGAWRRPFFGNARAEAHPESLMGARQNHPMLRRVNCSVIALCPDHCLAETAVKSRSDRFWRPREGARGGPETPLACNLVARRVGGPKPHRKTGRLSPPRHNVSARVSDQKRNDAPSATPVPLTPAVPRLRACSSSPVRITSLRIRCERPTPATQPLLLRTSPPPTAS